MAKTQKQKNMDRFIESNVKIYDNNGKLLHSSIGENPSKALAKKVKVKKKLFLKGSVSMADSKTSPKTAVKMQENNRRLVIFREGMIYNSKDDVPAGETAFRILRGKNAGKFGSRRSRGKKVLPPVSKAPTAPPQVKPLKPLKPLKPKAITKHEPKIKQSVSNYKTINNQSTNYIKALNNTPNGSSLVKTLTKYTANDYMAINGLLAGKSSGNAEQDKKAQYQIKNLDNLLKNAPKLKEPIEVLRMTKLKHLGGLGNIKSGNVIELPTFLSTSQNSDAIKDYNQGEGSVTLKIKTKEGLFVNGASHFQREAEVVLPRGRKFKINNYNAETNEVELEMMEE